MHSGSIWRSVIYLFVLLLISAGANALTLPTDTIWTSRIHPVLELENLPILETECSECGIPWAVEQRDAFELQPVDDYPSDASATYWIRLVIVNNIDSIDRLIVSSASNDMVDGFFLSSGHLPQVSRSGRIQPLSSRSLKESNSLLQFRIPRTADTAALYLRIRNNYSHFQPQLGLSFLSKESLDYREGIEAVRDNISIAFQGAIGLMLAIMLLIYVQNRQRMYLYYSLYMAGTMLYLSSTISSNIYVNYVFKEFPLVLLYLYYPLQMLFYIAYNKFMDAFLDLKKSDPWLHAKVTQLNLTFAGILMASLFFHLVTGDALTTTRAWAGISLLMILAYTLLLYRLITTNRTPYASFLITGMTIFLVASVVCTVLVNFVHPQMLLSPYNILEMGLFAEIICFSLGLGYKMWLSNRERERIQEAYIHELKRNESIIQQANIQLEQKVRERTGEIIRKNQEIDDQRKKQIASEYERKLAIAEMSALRAQMNPHFMFNTLNTLEALILEKRACEASEFLNKFSKLLRLVLENSRQLLVSVEKDVEALKLYVQLEQIRYDNRFNYRIMIDPELLEENYQIPPLMIQPFVENAIVHGLFNKTDQGHLEIELCLRNNKLYCRVEDNGIGRERAGEIRKKNKIHHESLGLKMTGKRIEVLNQVHEVNADVETLDLIDSEGNPAGTKVEIYLPLL